MANCRLPTGSLALVAFRAIIFHRPACFRARRNAAGRAPRACRIRCHGPKEAAHGRCVVMTHGQEGERMVCFVQGKQPNRLASGDREGCSFPVPGPAIVRIPNRNAAQRRERRGASSGNRLAAVWARSAFATEQPDPAYRYCTNCQSALNDRAWRLPHLYSPIAVRMAARSCPP